MKDRTPIFIVALVVLVMGSVLLISWSMFGWVDRRSPEERREEGRVGREVCEDYCAGAGGSVTEVRVVFGHDTRSHLPAECVCLVEEGVDPE